MNMNAVPEFTNFEVSPTKLTIRLKFDAFERFMTFLFLKIGFESTIHSIFRSNDLNHCWFVSKFRLIFV